MIGFSAVLAGTPSSASGMRLGHGFVGQLQRHRWRQRAYTPSFATILARTRLVGSARKKSLGRNRRRFYERQAEAPARPPSRRLSMFGRKTMTRRRFSAAPLPIQRCPSDIGVVVHENAARAGHPVDYASCWRPFVCATASGAPMPIRAHWPWMGATLFGMPHTARRRLGCARPSHPRLGSLPVQRSRAGRPTSPRSTVGCVRAAK